MKAEEFRRLALALPNVEESNHMDHPDFRVRGRIFATLGYPDDSAAMVKLYPAQQQAFIAAHPTMFVPVEGAWGAKGCTRVRLQSAAEAPVMEALQAAWRKAAVRTELRRLEREEGVEPLKRRRSKSPVALPARET